LAPLPILCWAICNLAFNASRCARKVCKMDARVVGKFNSNTEIEGLGGKSLMYRDVRSMAL
jgi:hypothetical protein